MNKFYELVYKSLGTFLGIGYLKYASGTVASGVAALLLFFVNSHYLVEILLILLLFVAGVKSANKLEERYGKDASCIVIDEVVGMWISLFFVEREPQYFLVAFILFRFFDISKTFYINKMEQLEGGLGVMMDDVLAGVYTNILVHSGAVFLKTL